MGEEERRARAERSEEGGEWVKRGIWEGGVDVGSVLLEGEQRGRGDMYYKAINCFTALFGLKVHSATKFPEGSNKWV